MQRLVSVLSLMGNCGIYKTQIIIDHRKSSAKRIILKYMNVIRFKSYFLCFLFLHQDEINKNKKSLQENCIAWTSFESQRKMQYQGTSKVSKGKS